MRPSLEIREFLHQYQQKLQLTFASAEIGLNRHVRLSRQAGDTFETVDYFNIRAMFGANALKRNKSLRLIAKMVELTSDNSAQFERIGDSLNTVNILGLEIPEVTLPVAPGRNLEVLVEAAARNHLLNMNGYNAAEEFIKRQNQAIEKNRQSLTNDSSDATASPGSEQ
jgi:hypothetical protein